MVKGVAFSQVPPYESMVSYANLVSVGLGVHVPDLYLNMGIVRSCGGNAEARLLTVAPSTEFYAKHGKLRNEGEFNSLSFVDEGFWAI